MAILGEIQEKERRVREFLKARDLQALLLKRQANFSWMTGGGLNVVGTATELGNASLLITEKGKFVITNNIEAPRMVEEERLEEQGYEVRSFPWYEDRELCPGPGNRRTGIGRMRLALPGCGHGGGRGRAAPLFPDRGGTGPVPLAGGKGFGGPRANDDRRGERERRNRRSSADSAMNYGKTGSIPWG